MISLNESDIGPLGKGRLHLVTSYTCANEQAKEGKAG